MTMDKGDGKGRIVKPAMGATLPPRSHNTDGDQTTAMLSAQWVPIVGRTDTRDRYVDP